MDESHGNLPSYNSRLGYGTDQAMPTRAPRPPPNCGILIDNVIRLLLSFVRYHPNRATGGPTR